MLKFLTSKFRNQSLNEVRPYEPPGFLRQETDDNTEKLEDEDEELRSLNLEGIFDFGFVTEFLAFGLKTLLKKHGHSISRPRAIRIRNISQSNVRHGFIYDQALLVFKPIAVHPSFNLAPVEEPGFAF
ncbi:hypothetical protein QZH41_014844 [Actinostola sp. cb2023]|nr:hypothetical protein QZH41_014844 [Actinostola sp. cb2023]